jgi:alpha-1,6-mannosyltransferase
MRAGLTVAGSGGEAVMIVFAFGIIFRLTLVPHAVVCSDDIFRYIWDGKVAASGINPFLYTPTDSHFSHFATADLPAKINHPEMRTIYPPLAEGVFFLAYRLFGASVSGMKFLIVCLECLTMILLWMFLHRRGNSVVPLLLYAWSPLPILYFGLDGHIDALGIVFLILSLVYFSTNRPFRGVVALGLSALAKLVPLLAAPLLLHVDGGKRRILLPVIPLLMVVCGYLFFIEPTWGVAESLRMFGSRCKFNGSVFSFVYFLTGSNDVTHQVVGILMLGFFGVLAVLNRPLIEKVFWGIARFFLLSPVVHPWYLAWLAALLVVRWSTAVFVFLGLSNIANVVVYQYRAFGEWKDRPLLLILEYLPVAILLVLEIRRNDFLRVDEEGSRALREKSARIP